MFRRPHHQRVATILNALNVDLLTKASCYFAGGTAIVLALDEYRESVDIDFLCASKEGYRLIRNTVMSNNLGELLPSREFDFRDVRMDRYGVRTILSVDGVPVKFEIVSEGRISLTGHPSEQLANIPVLSREDMYAEKLLANADRGLDKATMSRDIIDLAMMIDAWGNIPDEAWGKSYTAYGDHLIKMFNAAYKLISDKVYLLNCLHKMDMNQTLLPKIRDALAQQKQIIEKCLL